MMRGALPTKNTIDMTYYRQQEVNGRDAAPTVTRCAFCSDWTYVGVAKEGREAAIEHRLTVHPDLKPKRRPRAYRSSLSTLRQNLSEQDVEEIEVERRKRALLTGVELE